MAGIRKYACFTKEQQEAYERLPERKRLYVDLRGKGNKKTDAYRLAGYTATDKAHQAAYLIEKRDPVVQDLISCLQGQARIKSLFEENSDVGQRLTALAAQQGAENAMLAIDGADSEMAKRILFYRDIINGKIKSTKVTTRYNALGKVIDRKVEEINDIDTRLKARKELDNLLGISQVPDLSRFQMGDITINIVDASKKEEVEDSRNSIELDPTNVQIINGEKVIVTQEKKEVVKGDSEKVDNEVDNGE